MNGKYVALHAEGVDRNRDHEKEREPERDVALHAEGVDRNRAALVSQEESRESPSMRRAWIEIQKKGPA